MRADIHPSYGPVVFQDRSTGDAFLTRSTLTWVEAFRRRYGQQDGSR